MVEHGILSYPRIYRHLLGILVFVLLSSVSGLADQSIILRSGNGAVGSQDAQVRFVKYAVGQDTPPTDADFSAAQSGTFAYVDAPYPTYLTPANFSDPLAQWIGTTSGLGGGSALYAIPFTVTDTVIAAATLNLGYSVDNAVHGVYINGTEISNFVNDGDYHGEYYYMRSDVASLLKPNATNWLYIKTYDYAGYAGLMFSATIATQGTTPGNPTITPNQGGNAGSVSFRIIASGFEAGTSSGATPSHPNPIVTLTGIGSTVTATNVSVVSPNILTGTFDLTTASAGVDTVTITNWDGTSTALSNAFTVSVGGAPHLAVQKIGTPAVGGRNETFYVTLTNPGMVDSGLAEATEFVQPWFTFTGSTLPVFSTSSLTLPSGMTYNALQNWLVPNIPAGQDTTFSYTATVDPAIPANQVVEGSLCSTLVQVGSQLIEPGCYDVLESCIAGSLPESCLIGGWIGCGVSVLYCTAIWAGCTQAVGEICSIATSKKRQSTDPNDLVGPTGYGDPGWFQTPATAQYSLSFNNLPTATNPATNVYVTNSFNEKNLDLSSLAVSAITIGNVNYFPSTNVPLTSQAFGHDIDLRPSQNLIVRVNASLDQTSGNASVSFLSLDPSTGLEPTDPTVGFLPPGAGGTVLFTVNPKPALTTGTAIQSSGSVIFDTNAAIDTNTWTNTVDITAPVSKMTALGSTVPLLNFPVSWSGTDQGSGIANYSIYVSDNGGPFTEWLTNSMGTSSAYPGVAGHTYAFYSIATDNVGNVEAAKTAAETTTKIVLPAPTVTLTASSSMAFPAQSVTLTATVGVPAGLTIVPTGTVTFLSGTTTLGTGTLNASGVATLATALPNGNDSITAQYGGDTNYVASTSNAVSVSVGMLATATTLAASANPANLGASVTLTANVTPGSGTGVPTGTVTFNDGSTALGTVSLDNTGKASYSTSSLAAGAHSITAVYSGDPDYTGSTSTVLSLTVNASGFTVALAPTSLTVTAGSSGNTTVTITPVGGFNAQITFSCSGLPAQATCSFSPGTITPNGNNNAATSTLAIATDVQSAATSRSSPSHGGFKTPKETWLALMLFGLGGLARARRKLAKRGYWTAVVFVCGSLACLGGVLIGCGGGGSSSSGTPKGTSTVTVTATNGNTTQTAKLTLTIQ